MEIKNMTIEELEARQAELLASIDAPEVDSIEKVEEIRSDLEAVKAELEERKKIAAEKAEMRDLVAKGAGEVIEEPETEKREENKMTNAEIRNTPAYIDAYAEYIKSDSDAECRALLTENVSGGTVPIPELVYDIVKTAWDREEIMRRVTKVSLKGDLKVGFEISGSGAIVHTEGGAAIDPEDLVLSVVELKPVSIKKCVQISDEVYDMRGEAFLRYIYDELTYRIAKAAAGLLIANIASCGTVSTTGLPAVPKVVSTQITLGLIASAIANLSDEAANPVVIMNKLTYAAFKAAQYAASYPVDPFEGCPVIFNSDITAFSAATTGVTYAIVGDLGHGALANLPNGEEIEFKFDNLSLKKQDLIEILGREYVGVGVVAPFAFAKITK